MAVRFSCGLVVRKDRSRACSFPGRYLRFSINWRSVPEILWRALVFIIAVGILIFVSTRWNYWEGSPGWKETDDAYLQAEIGRAHV